MTSKSKNFFILCIVLSLAPIIYIGAWTFFGKAKPTLQAGNLLPQRVSIAVPHNPKEAPKWTLARLTNFNCDATCQGQLYLLDRLKLATGKDQFRINTGLVALKPVDGQDTVVVSQPKMSMIRSMIRQDQLLIVDPMGAIVMSYPGDVDPRSVSKDLKKLLKFSRIG